MSGAALRVGLAGLGVVGSCVFRGLQTRADLIARRAGRPITVVAVTARDRNRARDLDLSGVAWADSPGALAVRDDIDVFVELMGGEGDPALSACKAALAKGRPVVSANKAMVAIHGAELAPLAEAAGATLKFEAGVAGGVPVIKAAREALAANRITRVAGILNGTSNYILSRMRETGCAFTQALGEAQALGYAEADPTFDVDGQDAAHKLALLAAIAFGRAPDYAGVDRAGIRAIEPMDEAHAAELGYRIKLLGVAECEGEGAPLRQRVGPCLIEASAPLANVDGVLNAVLLDGDLVGRTLYEGAGAGGDATASAVLADLIDLAAGRAGPTFGAPAARLAPPHRADVETLHRAWYLRFTVRDEPGVMADVSAALRDEGVSIASMIQRARKPDAAVSVAFVLHAAPLGAVRRAVARAAAFPFSLEPPQVMPIEPVG